MPQAQPNTKRYSPSDPRGIHRSSPGDPTRRPIKRRRSKSRRVAFPLNPIQWVKNLTAAAWVAEAGSIPGPLQWVKGSSVAAPVT